MKTIAILSQTIKPGGAEKQATLLATLLDKEYEVHMYLYFGYIEPNPQNLTLLKLSNVKVHPLEGNDIKKIRTLASSLKHNKVDILFNYLTKCDVVGCIAGQIAGVKHIYGGIRSAQISSRKVIAERIIHNYFSSGTIFNSYSGMRDIGSKGLKEEKSIVIPNCFPDIADHIIRSDNKVKNIITVGRFVPPKDFKTLIESVSRLNRDDFRLCIVGYGELEDKIRSWVKDFGIENKTDIYIRPDNISELERNADIYLSTSLYEGTSNSIMEALNWSLPIVATNVGDNDHLVIDGENGFLHPIGDVEGISASLCRLLDDASLRNKMGNKSNQNLRENFSMEIFEKRYIDLIEGK